jgi:hypothetical protein
MGQAKKRGSFDQRKEEAVSKEEKQKAEEAAAPRKSVPLSRNEAQALLMAATFADAELERISGQRRNVRRRGPR